jgi:hypothetical protein
MNYPLMKRQEIIPYIPEMIRLGVSEVARSHRGFLTNYLSNPEDLSDDWVKKRNAFIARTLPAYLKNPTYPRLLSLYAWAYKPPM